MIAHTLTLPSVTRWLSPLARTRSQPSVVEVAFLDDTPAWTGGAELALRRLMALPVGWGGTNTGPINRATFFYVRSILDSVMSDRSPLPSFVPAQGGSVQLEWHRNGLDVELMVYGPSEAELSVIYLDGREPFERHISQDFSDLCNALSELS